LRAVFNVNLAGHAGVKIHGPNARKQSTLADKKIGEVGEMNPDNSQIMTVRELADYLRVHPTTIYRQLKLGQLPAFMGRQRMALQRRGDRSLVPRTGQLPRAAGLKVRPSK
jgi:excisionase family DNA binding protein